MLKRTVKQLFKEFWIQIILSLSWAIYKVVVKSRGDQGLSVFVANFSTSLFLLSWMAGQFVRVRKQHKIEDEFSHVKTDLQQLVTQLEVQTENLIGYTTGGESVVLFKPDVWGEMFVLNLDHEGKYPAVDVEGYWLDVDRSDIFLNRFKVGSVSPQKKPMAVVDIDLSGKSALRINTTLQTRTKVILQEFRVIKVGDNFKIASRTQFDGQIRYEIPADFPDYNSKSPQDLFT